MLLTQNKGKYIFLLLLATIINILGAISLKQTHGNMGNLYFLIYKDKDIFSSINSFDDFPTNWFLINISVCFIFGKVFWENLNSSSIYNLLRSKSYKIFWLSKVSSITINVIGIYLVLFLITFFVGLVSLDENLIYSPLIFEGDQEIMKQSVSLSWFLCLIFFIYVSTSIVLILIQAVLNLFIEPQYSFICVVLLIFISLFLNNPYLPASHSMLSKYGIFNGQQIFSWFETFVYSVIAILILNFIGYRKIVTKDIL